MTESKWLKSRRASEMMAHLLEGKPCRRKLRLFVAGCSRRSQHRRTLAEEEAEERQVTDLAERFADGLATAEELQAAHRCKQDEHSYWIVADADIEHAANAYARPDRMDCNQTEKAGLLRDLFGNPFRKVEFDARWRTPTVISLAEAAYEERIMPKGELDPVRLSILADALEDGGCSDESILTHLRSAGPHTRGCWAVDRCLGKE